MGVYVGIDPGIHGSIVSIYRNGKIHELHDIPNKVVGTKTRIDPLELQKILLGYQRLKDVKVACEALSAVYKASSSSAFTFGLSFGLVVGILAVTGFKVHFVRPQVWKADIFGADRVKGSQKSRSVQEARARFHDDYRIKRHDTAEALLIADWLRLRDLEGKDC